MKYYYRNVKTVDRNIDYESLYGIQGHLYVRILLNFLEQKISNININVIHLIQISYANKILQDSQYNSLLQSGINTLIHECQYQIYEFRPN